MFSRAIEIIEYKEECYKAGLHSLQLKITYLANNSTTKLIQRNNKSIYEDKKETEGIINNYQFWRSGTPVYININFYLDVAKLHK